MLCLPRTARNTETSMLLIDINTIRLTVGIISRIPDKIPLNKVLNVCISEHKGG